MEWKYSDDRKHVLIDPPKRTKKITGHRFPSVLGLNKYQTPFGAWCEITGVATLPFETNKYMEAGKAIEPKQIDYARTKFPNILSSEEYYGANWNEYKYSNFKDLGRIFDGVRDFVSVKNDGISIAMVGECKTSSKPQDWENNNVPIEYLCQGMLYAYLDKLEKIVFVTSFLQPMDYSYPNNYKVTPNNTKYTVKKLNECYLPLPTGEYGTIDLAIDYCEDWWKTYVETGTSPEFDEELDKEYLTILRKNKPVYDTELTNLCEQAIEIAKEIKRKTANSGIDVLEKDLKLLEKAIKESMITQNIDIVGDYTLKRNVKTSFDEKKFAEDNKTLYNKYCVEKITYTLNKNTKDEEKNDNEN